MTTHTSSFTNETPAWLLDVATECPIPTDMLAWLCGSVAEQGPCYFTAESDLASSYETGVTQKIVAFFFPMPRPPVGGPTRGHSHSVIPFCFLILEAGPRAQGVPGP